MHTREILLLTETCSGMLTAALFVDEKLEAPWIVIIRGVGKFDNLIYPMYS